MIYVGIDIAKLNHYASMMNSDGEVLVEPFMFSNNFSGFQKLLDCISSFPKDELFIGMESTAHYAENLTSFLFTRDFNVCIINPIQTSSLRKPNIRKTKTDSVDTCLIIKALSLNHFRLYSQRDYDSFQLKYDQKFFRFFHYFIFFFLLCRTVSQLIAITSLCQESF